MKIKKWIDFTNEDIFDIFNNWIPEHEVREVFRPLEDEGYPVDIEKGGLKKSAKFGTGISGDIKYDDFLDEDDLYDEVRDIRKEYYPGYRIIISSQGKRNWGLAYTKGPDVTSDFRNAISKLESDGYSVKILDDDGITSLKNIYFTNGGIITWVPEKFGDPFPAPASTLRDTGMTNPPMQQKLGDIYSENSDCIVYILQEEIQLL